MQLLQNSPSNNGERTAKGQFIKGNKCGKGRAEGSKSKAQLVLQEVGQENATNIYQILIDKALSGDLEIGRFIIDKVLPNAKGNRIEIELPVMENIGDVLDAQAMVLHYICCGEITLEEGERLFDMIEQRRKAIETSEIIDRMREIDQRMKMAGIL